MNIISRFKNKIPKNLPFKYIGILLISLSLILAILSIPIAVVLREQKSIYLASQNINVEPISIKMRDDVVIKGLIYVDKDLKENDTNSIPTILFLHGINGRKEHKVNIIFQYVKLGYAVISVEQRGHGESGSPSGFLNKEPQDMSEVIDYIEANYHYANTTHMGVIGFSYGGGIGAILQALEDRVYATVLYHPLASLDGLSDRIPLQNLIGTTIAVSNIGDIQDAFDLANTTNTENLLLLQGLSDKIILPRETIDFYNLVNGTNRSDVGLKERPGLGHEGNELDTTSLKYAVTWLNHFFYNQSIDISDLDNEISTVSLLTFNYPLSSTSENLTIASAIILFIGLSIIVLKLRILPYWDKLPIKKDIDLSREGKEKYKKMIIYRTSGYFGALFVSGIIFSFLNRSLLYGYFIVFPILSSIIMLFFPSELHSNWKEEWKNWIKNDSKLFLYTLSIILIPAIYFLSLYNLNNKLTIGFTIPFFRISTIPYIALGLGSGINDYLYLREMKGRHAMILMIIRPVSIIIFFALVPLSPFPILGGVVSQVLFIFLTGVILFYIRSLVNYLSKIYKNSASLYLLVMLPFVIFYLRVFFRII
ncbi:MAG: alpha/beta hydrolase [Promethearchaeota archaeon]|jgi:alpha-beta hydrolase superfamily lysophospholipase